MEMAKLDAEKLHQQKRDELANLDKVHFGFDSSVLTGTDNAKLGELVNFMIKYPETVILVKGHADSRGPSAYNE